MSVSRFISCTAAAALIAAVIPAVAHAQSGKTACNDGSTTPATGANACDGHGGIHRVNSTILHRAPSRTTKKTPTEPARVSQAGTPATKRDEKPRYEERRGWRWGRHHDEKREERREERREEKHHRVRCRDGKYENVPPGKAKGHEVCKHHGGER